MTRAQNRTNKRSLKEFLKWFAGFFLLLTFLFMLFIYVFLDPLVKKRIIRGVSNASDGLYVLDIGKLDAHFWSGAIEMDEVWLKPNQALLKKLQEKDTSNYIPDVNLHFDSVSISHIAWFSYLLNRSKLVVGKVWIHQPEFIITTELDTEKSEVREQNQKFLDFLPGIIAAFTGSLQIDEIFVRNGKLHYDLLGNEGAIHQLADSVYIDLQKIKIDTIASHNALYSERAAFDFRNYRLSSPHDLNILRIQHVQGNIQDSSLAINEIYYFQKDSVEEKYKDRVEVKVNRVQAKGVNYGSLLKDQEILVRTMSWESPSINWIASEDPVKKFPSDTIRQSILDQLIPYVSGAFRIDTLSAHNGKIRYQIQNEKKSILQKADDINLLFTRVLVDTLKTNSKVFAEDIRLDLKDYFLEKDTTSKLSIAKLEASISDSLFNLNTISFRSFENGNYRVKVNAVKGRGVDFLSAFEKRKARADSIIILNPTINVFTKFHSTPENTSSYHLKGESIQQAFYDLLGNFSDAAVKVQNFYVEKGDISFQTETENNLIEQHASDIRLIIHGVRIDSSRESINNFYDNFFVTLNDYHIKVHKDNFKVLMDAVTACSQKRFIQMENIEISQIKSFGKEQRTYFTNTIDIARANDFYFEEFINHQRVHSDNFTIQEMKLRIFLDEGKQDNPPYMNRMPNDLMKSLPFYLRLDTLEIIDSYLSYEDESPEIDKPGKLSFENLNAQVINLTNDPSLMSSKNPARLRARTRLMGEGNLRFHVRIPLLEEKLNGHYGGYLGSMKGELFNSFLSFAGLRIEEGKLDSCEFHVDIENGNASGNLLLLYEDLKVKVIEPKSQKVEHLKSFLGNIIVKNSNPPDKGDDPEVAELSASLEKGDGFFFFLWKVLKEGVVETVTKSTLYDVTSKQ